MKIFKVLAISLALKLLSIIIIIITKNILSEVLVEETIITNKKLKLRIFSIRTLLIEANFQAHFIRNLIIKLQVYNKPR